MDADSSERRIEENKSKVLKMTEVKVNDKVSKNKQGIRKNGKKRQYVQDSKQN